MKKRLLFSFLFCAVLYGCGSNDTEYYINHPVELKKKLEECKAMSTAEKMADSECTAVGNAISKKFYGDKIQKPAEGQGKELPKY
jgi:hypothetical protein